MDGSFDLVVKEFGFSLGKKIGFNETYRQLPKIKGKNCDIKGGPFQRYWSVVTATAK